MDDRGRPSDLVASAKSIFFDPNKLKTHESEEKSCLGSGSYGSVHKCYEPAYNIVAVKCMKTDGITGIPSDVKKNALREAKVVMKANHANVVRLFGLTTFAHVIGLVMEYMPGGSLDSLISDASLQLSWPFRLRVAHEISSGLAFLHEMVIDGRNIVHGDLKPANVLLDADLHAKLADFGSSTVASVATATSSMHLQAQGYTPAFCAPEVMDNPFYKPKPSSDMFSFGMTLYNIVFREVPLPQFRGGMAQLKDALMKGRRPSTEGLARLRNSTNIKGRMILDNLISVMQSCWKSAIAERMTSLQVRESHFKVLNSSPEEEIYSTITTVKKKRKNGQEEDTRRWIPLTNHFTSEKEKRNRNSSNNDSNSSNGEQTVIPIPRNSNSSDSGIDSDLAIQLKKLMLFNNLFAALGASEVDNEGKETLINALAPIEEAVMNNDRISYVQKMENYVKMSLEVKNRCVGRLVYRIADSLKEQGKLLQSLLAFQLISKIFIKDKTIPRNASDFMQKCACEIVCIAAELLDKDTDELKLVVEKFIIPGYEDIIDDLCNLSCIDKVDRLVAIGWCCKYFSRTYDKMGNTSDCGNILLRGARIMERNIGKETARKYRILGYLHHMIGGVLMECNQPGKAMQAYIDAKDCMEHAEDWSNGKEKEEALIANHANFLKARLKTALSLNNEDCVVM